MPDPRRHVSDRPLPLAPCALVLLALAAAPAAAASIDVLRAGLFATGVTRFDGTTGAAADSFVHGGPALGNIFDLGYGPDANLYVASDAGITRYDGTTGAYVSTVKPPPIAPFTFGADGALYTADSMGIGRYDRNTGARLSTFAPSSADLEGGATKMVFGTDGRLYVALYHGGVLRYDTNGTPLGFFVGPTSGGAQGAQGLVFAPDGSLLVTSGPGVLRFDGKTGAFKNKLVDDDHGDIELLMGPDGYLYVSHRDGRVTRHDPTSGAGVDTLIGAGGPDFPRLAFTPCSGGGAPLCLGRFSVETRYRTPQGESGFGHAVSLTADTGYFWFFEPSNVEVVTKIFSACVVNQRYWTYSAGLTDLEVTVAIRDSHTGQVAIYANPPRTPFRPVGDTSTLVSCGASTEPPPEPKAAGGGSSASDLAPDGDTAGEALERATDSLLADALAAAKSCSGLCLDGSRFQVSATWTTADGNSGSANGVQMTADTGYLWFFSPANVEVVLKVLDACAFNHRYWVYAGGLTDVKVTLTVRDTVTGVTRTYGNPQGKPFAPITDSSAFVCP